MLFLCLCRVLCPWHFAVLGGRDMVSVWHLVFALLYVHSYQTRGEREGADRKELASGCTASPWKGHASLPIHGIFPVGQLSPCTGGCFWGLLLFRAYRFSHSPMGPIFAYTSYYWKQGCCCFLVNLLLNSETPYPKVCQLGASDKCC